MITLVRGGGRLPVRALALAFGVWVFSGSWATADGGPGLSPGFQGFGLGYHKGYGYGGDAFGVGPDGGYPFYGGPGYPHCEPRLRRLGRFEPFPYYGGPGYPSPGQPNYFGSPGPLVAEQPVLRIGDGYDPGYGCFTGGPPNAEAAFAPFTTTAAAGGSYSGVATPPPSPNTAPAPGTGEPPPSTPPTPGALPIPPGAGRPLGIDTEPVVEAGDLRGLKVSRVRPGTAAEKAGLHSGDVIHSINGYLTTQRGNLPWIIAKAAPNNVLEMSVRTASDGKEHTVTAQLP